MLEYALKQERAKFHKLKYGSELQQGDMKPPPVIDDPSLDSQVNGIILQNLSHSFIMVSFDMYIAF